MGSGVALLRQVAPRPRTPWGWVLTDEHQHLIPTDDQRGRLVILRLVIPRSTTCDSQPGVSVASPGVDYLIVPAINQNSMKCEYHTQTSPKERTSRTRIVWSGSSAGSRLIVGPQRFACGRAQSNASQRRTKPGGSPQSGPNTSFQNVIEEWKFLWVQCDVGLSL